MTVYGLEHAGQIRDIEILKQVNSHSVCSVTMFLDDSKSLFRLQHLIGKEMSVEDNERIYMRGIVTSVSGTSGYSRTAAVVTIRSLSCKTDEMPACRIFQDTKKTYADIFQALEKKAAVIQASDQNLYQKHEPGIVCQYWETDFAFAVRIASENSCDVFVNDTDTVCMLNIGKSTGRFEHKIENGDILSLSWSLDEQTDFMEARLRAYYELGSVIVMENQSYVVISSRLLFHNGETECSYGLRRKLSESPLRHCKRQTFHVGLARVAGNEDPDSLGRIQAEFLDFEDALPSNRIWIPYLPPLTEKDGGQVLIPDRGETVHVFVENGQCYADGCVRQVPFGAQSGDVNARTLSVRNHFLTFTDNRVQAKSLGYELTVEEDSLHIGRDGVTIDITKNEVSVTCQEACLKLNANRSCMEGKSLRLRGHKIEAITDTFDIIS